MRTIACAKNQNFSPSHTARAAAGRFEITGLREAPYGVVAHHERYIQTQAATKIFVGPEMNEEPAVLTMEQGGTVMGHVSFQGKLLPGQQIRLAYPYGIHDSASVSTDDAGAYVFQGLYPGRVKVATSMSTGTGLTETAFTVRVDCSMKRPPPTTPSST